MHILGDPCPFPLEHKLPVKVLLVQACRMEQGDHPLCDQCKDPDILERIRLFRSFRSAEEKTDRLIFLYQGNDYFTGDLLQEGGFMIQFTG